MSFFEELKRRNVIRAALLYVVAAWVLLQVADVLASVLPVPEWTGTLLFVILAIGFFPVVIFSWVYEITPEGVRAESSSGDRNRTDALIVGLMVVAIGILIADRFLWPDKAEHSEGGGLDRKSVAVLAFQDLSAEGNKAYFSEGFSEELLNLLAKIPELRVAARTSAFSLRGKDLTVPEIGERLNVRYVLEGSVRQYGSKIRITTQLIDAQSDTHLWSETYDKEAVDLFEIQDDIAAKVVKELQVKLLGAVSRKQTIDPETYQMTLEARHLNRTRDFDNVQIAIDMLERVLEQNPNNADAWVELARSHSTLSRSSTNATEWNRRVQDAIDATDKALAIDPSHALAFARRGNIFGSLRGDVQRGVTELEKAYRLDPNNAEIMALVAGQLSLLHRYDESLAFWRALGQRDPLCTWCYSVRSYLYERLGQFERAEQELRQGIALSPDFSDNYWSLGRLLLVSGKPEEALEVFGRDMGGAKSLVGRTAALFDLRQEDAFQTAKAEFRDEHSENWPSGMAMINAWSGDKEAALDFLERSFEQHFAGYFSAVNNTFYLRLYDEPRWQRLMERAGTSDEQLQGIIFEVELPEDPT